MNYGNQLRNNYQLKYKFIYIAIMDSDKYLHSNVENKIYTYWEKNNLFKPKPNSKKIFNSYTTT